MVRVIRLQNGVRLVLDRQPTAKTVSIIIGIGRGSRDEPRHYAGWMHVIEHLACERYSGKIAVARQADRIGAETNAQTSSDSIMFWYTVAPRYGTWSFHLLAELVQMRWLEKDDLQNERGVVIEELASHPDYIDTRLERLHLLTVLGQHPLANDVLGHRWTLRRMRRDAVLKFWMRLLDPAHLTVTVVGRFERNVIVRLTRELYGNLPPVPHPFPQRAHAPLRLSPTHYRVRCEGLGQVHYNWTVVSSGYRTPHRLALMVLNNVIGGRYSAVPYLQLRDYGLTYEYCSSIWFDPEIGRIQITGEVTRAKLFTHLEVIGTFLHELRENGVPRDEFELAIEAMTASARLRFASTEHRAKFYTGQLLTHGHVIGFEEHLRRLHRLTRRQVNNAAARFLTPRNFYFSAIGPFTRTDRQKLSAMFPRTRPLRHL